MLQADHLTEFSFYYSVLKVMEDFMKKVKDESPAVRQQKIRELQDFIRSVA